MPENETHKVKVAGSDGRIIDAEFLIWEVDPDDASQVKLSLRYTANELISAADNFFEAMRSIRLRLEQDGLLLCCYGASKNVYPSPMMLDMGAGEKAYKLQLGHHARLQDVVWIFDTGPDVTPVTVKEQEAFYIMWGRSLNTK